MTQRLDVLHVLDTLGHGGAEQNLLSIVRRLDPARYRHHFAWLYDDLRLLEKFRPYAATLLPLNARNSHIDIARAAVRLGAWLRENPVDVVHVQLVRAHLVARIAARLAGRLRGGLGGPPVVTTWQNAYYDENAVADFGSPARRQLMRIADAVSGRGDRGFIAVSEHVAAHCARELGVGRDRVRVIYNAVEPARYAEPPPDAVARARAELGLRAGERALLAVGRLVPQKGHADLIAAMPAILRRVPRAVLLVAGGGPLLAELRARAAGLALGDRVRLLGVRGDVATLYRLADLFLLPSLYEGLSVALVEALANGLPSVVSDIPQNREVAEKMESVKFVPRGDIAAIAEATISMLEMGAAARQAAEAARGDLRARFHPEVLARRFAEAFEEAAHR